MAKATTVKEAIKNFETAKGVKAPEVEKVSVVSCRVVWCGGRESELERELERERERERESSCLVAQRASSSSAALGKDRWRSCERTSHTRQRVYGRLKVAVWRGVVWLSAVGARKLHGGFVALCCAQHGACSSTSCRARFVFAS